MEFASVQLYKMSEFRGMGSFSQTFFLVRVQALPADITCRVGGAQSPALLYAIPVFFTALSEANQKRGREASCCRDPYPHGDSRPGAT